MTKPTPQQYWFTATAWMWIGILLSILAGAYSVWSNINEDTTGIAVGIRLIGAAAAPILCLVLAWIYRIKMRQAEREALGKTDSETSPDSP